MRYVSLAYGTRQEILDLIDNNLDAKRSERRREELWRARLALEEGADSVVLGPTTYHVEETPEVP